MEQLLDVIPGGWLGMVFVIALLGPPTILSSWAAKIPGFLGTGARRWRNRQVEQVDREISFQERIDKAVEKRVEIRLAQFEQYKSDFESAKRDMDLAYDYIAYVSGWLRALHITAKVEGWTLPPPPVVSFSEYKSSKLASDADG